MRVRSLFSSFLLLFVLGLLFATEAAAAASVYYVSPTGNDNNSGTSPSTPWKTITRVNSTSFSAGDQILFEGGQTFAGSLYFDTKDSGTPSAPIVVGSYGTGRAVISSGNNPGLYAYNTSGFRITNLAFTGSGATNTEGIFFYADLSGSVKLGYVHIDHVDVSQYGDTGIMFGGGNRASGYDDVSITDSVAHDNGVAGIVTYGQGLYSHTHVYVGHCQAYNNTGRSNWSTNSGNGIVLGSVNGGTIERSLAHDNGGGGNGSVGIWTYNSNNITIQYDESYNNKTGGSADGGGFDLDGGTTNSVMQYDYSHNNQGAGFGLYEYSGAPAWSKNTLRYNISENDGRKNSYGSITVWNGGSGIGNAEVYNNTVYVSPAPSGTPRAIYFKTPSSNFHLRNNILITTSGIALVQVPSNQSGLLFQGNDYYPSGGAFKIGWYGMTYSTLSSWQTATGQEKNETAKTGASVDPQLTSPGKGGTIGDADLLNTLSAYRLKSTSPMINTGLNLQALFGVNPGTQDFYGTLIPQRGSFDVGANEY